MLLKREHGQQMYAVILLGEVRLLRESEHKLRAEIAVLKDTVSARAEDGDCAASLQPSLSRPHLS